MANCEEYKRSPYIPWVYGEGIKTGIAGKPVIFTLDMRYSLPGHLDCSCRAPSGRMTYMLIHDNKDGTFTMDLNTCEIGLHTVEIKWNEEYIPGCPFVVKVQNDPAVKMVRVYGTGLNSHVFGTSSIFHLYNNENGPGKINIRFSGPESNFNVETWVDEEDDHLLNFKYNPTVAGIYTAEITWVNEDGSRSEITGSPYEIFLAPNNDDVRKWGLVIRDSKIKRLEEFQ